MAEPLIITQGELIQAAQNRIESLDFEVVLADSGGTLTETTSLGDWLDAEISGGGYARFSGTTGSATWNGTLNQAEVPVFNATFEATTGFTHDTVLLYFIGRSVVHALITFPDPVLLGAGEPLIYPIRLAQRRV